MNFAFANTSHRRWNPLRREWVLVSPHRTQRPWQGQIEASVAPVTAGYDPTCYLCPGNSRAGGETTPHYKNTFVFDNDFPALTPDANSADMDLAGAGLLCAETETGICRVLCFDPAHNLTLATMPVAAIRRVVGVWCTQEAELAKRPDIAYVQVFENRGAMMGASNPHPHGQIWGTQHIPNEPLTELHSQQEYFHLHVRPLLIDYLKLELSERERVVIENDDWVVVVPFWAVWPFETLLLPRKHTSTLSLLTAKQRDGLAAILSAIAAGYNGVFDTPFPYSMGFHPAPADGRDHPEWTVHAHFYPPLLRSAAVRKFMVGFELLGSPQRDITPESAASTLRASIRKGA